MKKLLKPFITEKAKNLNNNCHFHFIEPYMETYENFKLGNTKWCSNFTNRNEIEEIKRKYNVLLMTSSSEGF